MNYDNMMNNTVSGDLREPSPRIHTINISDLPHNHRCSRRIVA
jgi:hypothetical protein